MQMSHIHQLEAIKTILENENLPTADICEGGPTQFFGSWADSKLCGVVGIELYNDCVLVRSLAVVPEKRGKGIGAQLLEQAETFATEKGAHVAYILTTTASEYFSAHGYKIIERKLAPVAIRESAEFKSLCPESAALMVKPLQRSELH